MEMHKALAWFASALAAEVAFGGASAPGEWHPVRTNEITRWSAERGAEGGVVVDRGARRVSFLVEATGVSEVDPVEFFVIGPLSDRAYESFAVSVASPGAIAAGLDAIGVPRGVPVNPARSRFWPQGEGVSLAVRAFDDASSVLTLRDLLKDERAAEDGAILEAAPVATGGARDVSGAVVAQTNMPCAIFALYSHAPSLLQLDGTFDQSVIYGRFRSLRRHRPGDLFEMTLSYSGSPRVEERVVNVKKGADLAPILGELRAIAGSRAVYAKLAFAPDVPLAESAAAAKAFSLVDGSGVRMNGAAPGQFFYRAFLPDPEWRRREGRIFQPFEVHMAPDGRLTFVFVEEDYSGSGIDPVLKPRAIPFSAWRELPKLVADTKADKVDVMFVFAPAGTPIGRLTPVLSAVSPRISTFYLFADESPAEAPRADAPSKEQR